MSMTTFQTPTGHCVQITTATTVNGTLRISGYGPDIPAAKQDAIDKLKTYLADRAKNTPTRQEAIERYREKRCI